MKDDMNPQRAPNPQGTARGPPTYIPPPPLEVLKKPIPHQGFINTWLEGVQRPHP